MRRAEAIAGEAGGKSINPRGVDPLDVFPRFVRSVFERINNGCTAFRKVRPVATEESEVVQRILSAKPGADRVREGV